MIQSTVSFAAQRAAHARWTARRRKLIALGQWQPFVDAEPVRDRIRDINRAGMPTSLLCDKIDLPDTALEHVMWKRDGVASQLVRRETAEAVMGYWPTLQDLPAYSLIDGTGVVRRVHALMTLGWTRRAIAHRAGLSEKSLSRALSKDRVTVETVRSLNAAYDVLWRRQPRPDEVSSVSAERARIFASRHGFAGPLAWDDESIDDPKAVPMTDVVGEVVTEGGNLADRWLLGESVILGRDDRREVLAHLFEWTNDTTAEIAARLEMSPEAAERSWERMKERAAAEGRRLWRRVYIPRDRDMKQNELEEAA